MLEKIGWEIIDHIDLTAPFLESLRRMLEEEAHADELGEDDSAARLARGRSRVSILEQGATAARAVCCHGSPVYFSN